uniref:Reverse transcriptase domain-containing protein n=1 Tax=Tanacetum cinerariifolium TaxID=118510 RepID=A0A6L2M0B3_TANCI|nr:hypothetical protein [Tanacetum cinerariifolium]
MEYLVKISKKAHILKLKRRHLKNTILTSSMPYPSRKTRRDDVIVISSDKVEGSGDWNSLEYQDITGSKGNKVMNVLSFYKMETYEVSERYIASCFMSGLEAYDGEIHLAFDSNLISNEYAVKLCLDYKVIAIYPKPDPFEDDFEKTEKSLDDWDQLLDFNFDDAVMSAGGHLIQEEAAKEALTIRIIQKFALLEEVRPVIETMAYHEKHKKILDEIWKDKVELDGKIIKEEEAVERIKGESLKEKDNLGAFIFPIRLAGKVNQNAEEMKKVNRGITMINHTQMEAMGILTNVLCQVEITTIIVKFIILDIQIDHDAPIVVGRGFLYTIGRILNTPEILFSTFDGVCHQTFRATRFDVLRTVESDSDDEEEYQIKRNKFGAPIYRPKHALYLNCNDPADRSLDLQTTMGTHDNEAGSSRSKHSRQHEAVEETHLLTFCGKLGCDGEIDDMLRIRLREATSDEEIFTLMVWIRAFTINEPIYTKLCHEFYLTYEFDEVCADDELQTKKIIKFRLGGRAYSLTLLEFAHRLGLYQAAELDEEIFNGDSQDDHLWFVSEDDWRFGYDTLRELIDSESRLISKDPQPGVPRFGIPRPPRASMQDLYDRMGSMEIRQEAIERM